MVSRPAQPVSIRVVRAAGLASLVGWISWLAARFEARPFWPFTWREGADILVWAVGLHLAIRLVEALTRSTGKRTGWDYARAYVLLLSCGWTFLWYFNAHRVGPLDAQWYQNVMTDFLTQARAGTFPVVVGSTVYSFNGAVHPFRSAPWQFVLADGVDILSGRTLAPVAVQHITAIASFGAAVLMLYVGFARSRPGARGVAWLFALGYALAPAATVPFFQYDMYMTMTAQPVMAAAVLCLQRVIDDDSIVASGWLGVFLAALWYCHPPMALLTGAVAGACAVAGVAARGLSARRLACGVVALAVFAALAAPYFRSMSELPHTELPRLATIGMPLAGMLFCLFAVAGFLRSRYLPWLALLPTGLLCLKNFQPSLVPFAGALAVAGLLAAWLTRGRSRRYDVAWLSVCALVAALVAAFVFPDLSMPGDMGSRISHEWRNFFVPITLSRTRVQPGYLLWTLVGAATVFVFATRSAFAQAAAAATFALVVSLGFLGNLSAFLWGNVPEDIAGVVGLTYDLRLVPVLAVVAVVGGFYWFTSLPSSRAGAKRAFLFVVVVLVPWSLWEEGVVLYDIRNFKLDVEETAVRNRSENMALERYSWDLLPPPRYINYGVMDPVLETRFWSDDDHGRARIDPDEIERALEVPDQRPVGLEATPIPTGKDWLTFEPRIELDPGQHVVFRFDFLGNEPDGYLIIQGQKIYREYLLPSSGRDYAFGYEPGNTHTLSLWNSGSAHESVQLLLKRGGPRAFDPPASHPFWQMHLASYVPARAPIELYSLIPLRLRVDAPTSGYLETFRSLIPGYKVYVDGKEAVVHGSRNALVSVRLAPGIHDIWVRFAGTVRLHTAVRWAMSGWLIAAMAAAAQLWFMARRPPLGPAEPAP